MSRVSFARIHARLLCVVLALPAMGCGRFGIEFFGRQLPNDADAGELDAGAPHGGGVEPTPADGGAPDGSAVDGSSLEAGMGAADGGEPATLDASVETDVDASASDAGDPMDTCMPRTDMYGAGSFSVAPPSHCTTLTVKLWGGGGASGDARAGYWASVIGGNGGAGGYATQVFKVSAGSMLQLEVGEGGRGCGPPGRGSIASLDGGTGGTGRAQAGTLGADGSRNGGSGGNSNSGGDGGAGSLGGGGGGAGTDPGFAPHGGGGGGGAATILTLGGTSVIAGGGGGGGGAGSDITTAGHSGGNGGAGCSRPGLVATNEGGGGGGGGACQGTAINSGSGRTPHDPNAELPASAARGGDGNLDCQPGGDGHVILSFSP